MAALAARLAAGRSVACGAAAAPEGRVSPGALFSALERLAPDAIYSTDSGNGLFLAMERLRLERPGRWLAPVDFSCMGYSVPAAIGAKLANPGSDVVAVAGDGALLMTGLSLFTAAAERAPIVACVLADGELGQIAQFQRLAFGRAAATALPAYGLSDFARLCGAEHVLAASDSSVAASVEAALASARAGRSAVLEVAIDASRPTFFTRGVLRANFARLPLKDKLRMAARKLAPR